MQVRVDDDMRVILTLTAGEYAALGGDKDLVASNVERVVVGEIGAPERVVVTPNAEFAIPADSISESAGGAIVTTPEVMTE